MKPVMISIHNAKLWKAEIEFLSIARTNKNVEKIVMRFLLMIMDLAFSSAADIGSNLDIALKILKFRF